MDPKTVSANLAAVETVAQLRDGGDALDVIVAYLGDDASGATARLAVALAALCSAALDERPEDPESWLGALRFVGEIEDSAKGTED